MENELKQEMLDFFKSDEFITSAEKYFGGREEPKDIVLDAYKWYTDGSDYYLVMESFNNAISCVGFLNGKWKSKYHISGLHSMKPANMEEVKRLLIGEAEKYIGNKVKCDTFGHEKEISEISFNNYGVIGIHEGCETVLFRMYSDCGTELYKWAQIVEPTNHIIELTETTKQSSKKTYYKCEIGAILMDTPDKNEAFVFEHIEGVKQVCEFIESNYDYKTKIIGLN